MFVIAHLTKQGLPYYIYKVNPDGFALIMSSLNDAIKFKKRQDAKEVLDSIKKDDVFTFKIFELGIIND